MYLPCALIATFAKYKIFINIEFILFHSKHQNQCIMKKVICALGTFNYLNNLLEILRIENYLPTIEPITEPSFRVHNACLNSFPTFLTRSQVPTFAAKSTQIDMNTANYDQTFSPSLDCTGSANWREANTCFHQNSILGNIRPLTGQPSIYQAHQGEKIPPEKAMNVLNHCNI